MQNIFDINNNKTKPNNILETKHTAETGRKKKQKNHTAETGRRKKQTGKQHNTSVFQIHKIVKYLTSGFNACNINQLMHTVNPPFNPQTGGKW